MGMPVSLAASAPCDDAWAAVMDDLRWVDEVFSTYKPQSFISRLARGEIPESECPVEVAEVLSLGEAARIASAGAFDINGSGVLDPTGVVKGWAVERASRFLREVPRLDFCLSAGGDMVCQSTGEPWQIGIENPLDPSRLIAKVPVRSGAVATSGTVHRGEHLRTADGGVASVTVIAESLTWADIDATAAYALGQRAAEWLRSRPGRKALVVWADGTPELVEGRPRSGLVRAQGSTDLVLS
jgi:thiamine biosynthesis lipoprotein